MDKKSYSVINKGVNNLNDKRFNLQKLKYERLSRNISQREVGEALGISTNAYSRKEAGTTNVTIEELPIILEAIGIEMKDVAEFY